ARATRRRRNGSPDCVAQSGLRLLHRDADGGARRDPDIGRREHPGEGAMTMSSRRLRLLQVLLLMFLLQGCDSALYTNLSELEANKMLAALLGEGISAGRDLQGDGLITVTVPEDRFAEAVALLNEAGLPAQKFSSMGDVFKSNSLVASPVQERAQMIYALSEEISHTVSQIDGVLSARVHVVLPDNDL